jgi:hypothetical protein
VLATALTDRVHPSVLAWCLVNEVAGNGHDAGEVSYVRDAASALHREDPGRPVAVDVWGLHPPAVAGPLYADIDAIGITNYIGWYEPPLGPPAAVQQAISARVAGFTRTFRGKVLVVTEFGAEASAQNPTDQPGGYAFQARVLREHIDAYAATPALSGMLVWDLRDFAVSPSFLGGSIRRVAPNIRIVRGLNQKGLFGYTGAPKPAAATVRQAYAGLAASARARGGL